MRQKRRVRTSPSPSISLAMFRQPSTTRMVAWCVSWHGLCRCRRVRINLPGTVWIDPARHCLRVTTPGSSFAIRGSKRNSSAWLASPRWSSPTIPGWGTIAARTRWHGMRRVGISVPWLRKAFRPIASSHPMAKSASGRRIIRRPGRGREPWPARTARFTRSSRTARSFR